MITRNAIYRLVCDRLDEEGSIETPETIIDTMSLPCNDVTSEIEHAIEECHRDRYLSETRY